MSVQGIDVSRHNTITDFRKVKASGIDFVIIRAGYGREISQKDPQFETNYKNAKAAGLNVGAYWYSYAQSVGEAKIEANVCLQAIKGKKFEYPIYFDLEENTQLSRGSAFCSALVKAFCGELEKAGYFAGLYMSRYYLQTVISSEVAKRYAVWVAEYNGKCNYSGNYGVWQNSSTWRVNGIYGNVDHDYCYIDYPSIIKKKRLNGYKEATAKKSIDTIAREVIAGKWGNGNERKKKLTAAGYDFAAVQKRVNQLIPYFFEGVRAWENVGEKVPMKLR